MTAQCIHMFVITLHGVRLKVLVLPTVKDVHEWSGPLGKQYKKEGRLIHAYFNTNNTNRNGHAVLPLNGCTPGIVAHEMAHCAINTRRPLRGLRDVTVALDDEAEEEVCTILGDFTDIVWGRMRQLQIDHGIA